MIRRLIKTKSLHTRRKNAFWKTAPGGGIFLGSLFPGGNFLGGTFPGCIFPGGIFPWGIFPSTGNNKLKIISRRFQN